MTGLNGPEETTKIFVSLLPSSINNPQFAQFIYQIQISCPKIPFQFLLQLSIPNHNSKFAFVRKIYLLSPVEPTELVPQMASSNYNPFHAEDFLHLSVGRRGWFCRLFVAFHYRLLVVPELVAAVLLIRRHQRQKVGSVSFLSFQRLHPSWSTTANGKADGKIHSCGQL